MPQFTTTTGFFTVTLDDDNAVTVRSTISGKHRLFTFLSRHDAERAYYAIQNHLYIEPCPPLDTFRVPEVGINEKLYLSLPTTGPGWIRISAHYSWGCKAVNGKAVVECYGAGCVAVSDAGRRLYSLQNAMDLAAFLEVLLVARPRPGLHRFDNLLATGARVYNALDRYVEYRIPGTVVAHPSGAVFNNLTDAIEDLKKGESDPKPYVVNPAEAHSNKGPLEYTVKRPTHLAVGQVWRVRGGIEAMVTHTNKGDRFWVDMTISDNLAILDYGDAEYVGKVVIG